MMLENTHNDIDERLEKIKHTMMTLENHVFGELDSD